MHVHEAQCSNYPKTRENKENTNRQLMEKKLNFPDVNEFYIAITVNLSFSIMLQ